MSDSFVTPWTVAHQAPLSMGFPRQEYWSGVPLPSPGDLPDPRLQPESPVLAYGFFTTEPPGKPVVESISAPIIGLPPWKCCTQYASKFGKLSSGHRTGKGQFSFQSQRKAMPKNAQSTAQLHSSHTLVK